MSIISAEGVSLARFPFALDLPGDIAGWKLAQLDEWEMQLARTRGETFS